MNKSWSTSKLPTISTDLENIEQPIYNSYNQTNPTNLSIINEPKRPITLSPRYTRPSVTLGPSTNLNNPVNLVNPIRGLNQINPFPDYYPDPFSFRLGSFEDDVLNLALHTLGLTKAEFSSISVSEIKSRFSLGIPASYAINILIHIKEKNQSEFTPRVNPISPLTPINAFNPINSISPTRPTQISPSIYDTKTVSSVKLKPYSSQLYNSSCPDELDNFVVESNKKK